MKQIDNYFHDQVDKSLYHYTGIDSLVGMAETKTLWASSVSYMNDSEEIIYACKVLEDVLKPRLEIESVKNPEVEFLKQFHEWINLHKSTVSTIFIFSLSEKSSLLSQWRSYTPHSKGVSIGFSPKKLNSIAKSNKLRIAKCLYEKDDQEEVLNILIENLLISFRKERLDKNPTLGHPKQRYYSFFARFRSDVLQVLSIIKNHSFKEEQEWRLISEYYLNHTEPKLKFRQGASMLVPYIELNLGEDKPSFEKVILGPSQHQNLSMSALSMFLINKGLCSRVQNCSIPYREW